MFILASIHIFVVTLFVFGPGKKAFRDSDKTVFLFSGVFSQSIEMTLFVIVTFFLHLRLFLLNPAFSKERNDLCFRFVCLAVSPFLPSFLLSFFGESVNRNPLPHLREGDSQGIVNSFC